MNQKPLNEGEHVPADQQQPLPEMPQTYPGTNIPNGEPNQEDLNHINNIINPPETSISPADTNEVNDPNSNPNYPNEPSNPQEEMQ